MEAIADEVIGTRLNAASLFIPDGLTEGLQLVCIHWVETIAYWAK
jgi:hypothetical protein